MVEVEGARSVTGKYSSKKAVLFENRRNYRPCSEVSQRLLCPSDKSSGPRGEDVQASPRLQLRPSCKRGAIWCQRGATMKSFGSIVLGHLNLILYGRDAPDDMDISVASM